jgi:hypothetical protein
MRKEGVRPGTTLLERHPVNLDLRAALLFPNTTNGQSQPLNHNHNGRLAGVQLLHMHQPEFLAWPLIREAKTKQNEKHFSTVN